MAANVKELPKTDRELSVMVKAGGQMTFAEALASAEAQCQQQRAAYVTSLSPEQLGAIQRNAAKPRPVGRRITIELERGSVVSRSQCPYVGFTTITSKKNGSL